MKRLLPSPAMTLVLWAAWLALNQTVSAGHVLLGATLAVVIPWWAVRLLPVRARLSRPLVALRLALVVLADIVKSNWDVAVRVLGPASALRSQFVWVPVTLRDPTGLVALAGIITMTPGTLTAEISPDRTYLLVHALHLEDPAALIDDIQRRYEAPLKLIFEGAEA